MRGSLNFHASQGYLRLFKEEFPQLSKSENDGFEHMVEDLDTVTENTKADTTVANPEERENILLLQKQLSKANLAREQQVHEIARLKASIVKQGESMMIGVNKSKSGQLNIRVDNFSYDEDTDTLTVIDDEFSSSSSDCSDLALADPTPEFTLLTLQMLAFLPLFSLSIPFTWLKTLILI